MAAKVTITPISKEKTTELIELLQKKREEYRQSPEAMVVIVDGHMRKHMDDLLARSYKMFGTNVELK